MLALCLPALSASQLNDLIEFNKGVVESKLGNDKGAKTHYDKELKNINDTSALYNRGNVNVRMGKYEQAIEDYNEVLKYRDGIKTNTYSIISLNDNQLVDVYNNKAFAEMNLKQYKAAIDDLNKALIYAKSSHYSSGVARATLMLNYIKSQKY